MPDSLSPDSLVSGELSKEFDPFFLPVLPTLKRAASMQDLGKNTIDGRFAALLFDGVKAPPTPEEEGPSPVIARNSRRSTLSMKGRRGSKEVAPEPE
jgi:hypothetical protein